MKHTSSRELFAYWAGRRGARAAPERAEIEPSAIRSVLGDVFILAFNRHGGHAFRLAGTRVCALFGRELKNEPFIDLWEAGSRAPITDLLAVAADEATGVVAAVTARTAEGWSQDLELLALPLSHRGDLHARMIGTLTPIGAPFWLGVSRLGDLTLGHHRHLNPAFEIRQPARTIVPTVPSTRRSLFTVYAGGRR